MPRLYTDILGMSVMYLLPEPSQCGTTACPLSQLLTATLVLSRSSLRTVCTRTLGKHTLLSIITHYAMPCHACIQILGMSVIYCV